MKKNKENLQDLQDLQVSATQLSIYASDIKAPVKAVKAVNYLEKLKESFKNIPFQFNDLLKCFKEIDENITPNKIDSLIIDWLEQGIICENPSGFYRVI